MQMPTTKDIEDVWRVGLKSEKEYERMAMLMSLRDLDHVALFIYNQGRRIEELEKQLKRKKVWRPW